MCRGLNKGDWEDVTLCVPRSNGMTTARVDKCIAPIVQALNDAGIQTLSSCCGHGKTDHAYIRIHEKYVMIQKFDNEFTFGIQIERKKRDV